MNDVDSAPDAAPQPEHVDRIGRRRPPRWLGWRRMLPLAVVAVVLYYLVNLFLVIRAGGAEANEPADAIVVLGAAQYNGTPSPQLAARLDHAVDLFDDGLADYIVVTGGKRPGDNYTESEAGRMYLVELGVPGAAVLSEDRGASTYDSMANVRSLLRVEGMSTVILVTDPYHTERTELIAQELGLDAVSSPTTTSVVRGGTELRRQLLEAGGVAVGRLIGFERLNAITD